MIALICLQAHDSGLIHDDLGNSLLFSERDKLCPFTHSEQHVLNISNSTSHTAGQQGHGHK